MSPSSFLKWLLGSITAITLLLLSHVAAYDYTFPTVGLPTGDVSGNIKTDSQGNLHILYKVTDTQELNLYKYSNGGRSQVGGAPVASGNITAIQFAFDSQDKAYVAYKDSQNLGGKPAMKVFSGGVWEGVGSANGQIATHTSPSGIRVAIMTGDVPVVSYKTSSSAGFIYKFESGSRSQRRTTAPYYPQALLADNEGQIWYTVSRNNPWHSRAYTYSGGSWSQIGGNLTEQYGHNLWTDSNNDIYLGGRRNQSNGRKARITKYDRSAGSWSVQGGADISTSIAAPRGVTIGNVTHVVGKAYNSPNYYLGRTSTNNGSRATSYTSTDTGLFGDIATDGTNIFILTFPTPASAPIIVTDVLITDTTPPQVGIDVQPGGNLTSVIPTVTGTGEVDATVTLTINGTTYTGSVSGDNTWSIAIPLLLREPSYTISYHATDAAGNTSATQSLLVNIVPQADVSTTTTLSSSLGGGNAYTNSLITATTTYNNAGTSHATGTVIAQDIPDNLCYVFGSVTAPDDTTLAFSDDNSSSWSYEPNYTMNHTRTENFDTASIDTDTWTEIDPNNSITATVNGLSLSKKSTAWNKILISNDTFSRSDKQTFYFRYNPGAATTSDRVMLGLGVSTSNSSWTQMPHAIYVTTDDLQIRQNGGSSLLTLSNVFGANDTMEFRITLQDEGAIYEASGGNYAQWTTLYIDTSIITDNLRPAIAQYDATATVEQISVGSLIDCAITDTQITRDKPLYTPNGSYQENNTADFQGTLTNTTNENDKIELSYLPANPTSTASSISIHTNVLRVGQTSTGTFAYWGTKNAYGDRITKLNEDGSRSRRNLGYTSAYGDNGASSNSNFDAKFTETTSGVFLIIGKDWDGTYHTPNLSQSCSKIYHHLSGNNRSKEVTLGGCLNNRDNAVYVDLQETNNGIFATFAGYQGSSHKIYQRVGTGWSLTLNQYYNKSRRPTIADTNSGTFIFLPGATDTNTYILQRNGTGWTTSYDDGGLLPDAVHGDLQETSQGIIAATAGAIMRYNGNTDTRATIASGYNTELAQIIEYDNTVYILLGDELVSLAGNTITSEYTNPGATKGDITSNASGLYLALGDEIATTVNGSWQTEHTHDAQPTTIEFAAGSGTEMFVVYSTTSSKLELYKRRANDWFNAKTINHGYQRAAKGIQTDQGFKILAARWRGPAYTSNRQTNAIYNYTNQAYASSGSYRTTIQSADLQARDTLINTHNIYDGTTITYKIMDSSCTTTLLTASNTMIDISSIDSNTHTTLCLDITLTTQDDQSSPVLDAFVATYQTSTLPSYSLNLIPDSLYGRSYPTILTTTGTINHSGTDPDMTNNTATGTITLIEADNTPPVITLATTGNTADNTPTLTGSIDDPTATIVVGISGTQYNATNNGSDWTITISPALAEGIYTVSLTGTDTFGNASNITGSLTINTLTCGDGSISNRTAQTYDINDTFIAADRNATKVAGSSANTNVIATNHTTGGPSNGQYKKVVLSQNTRRRSRVNAQVDKAGFTVNPGNGLIKSINIDFAMNNMNTITSYNGLKKYAGGFVHNTSHTKAKVVARLIQGGTIGHFCGRTTNEFETRENKSCSIKPKALTKRGFDLSANAAPITVTLMAIKKGKYKAVTVGLADITLQTQMVNQSLGLETCDDGDTDNNDGCSNSCVIEFGYTCTGEPSVCSCTLDSDNDSISDCLEGEETDSDDDGLPNYLDSDDDGDGIPTKREARLLRGKGASAATGDLNNDGTIDSAQDFIATIAMNKESLSGTADDLVTLETNDTAGTGACTITQVANISPEAVSSGETLTGFSFDYNMFDFEVTDCTGVNATFYIHGATDMSNYSFMKYASGSGWYTFTGAQFGTADVAGETVATITLDIQDNGYGDECPEEGVICDPGGPVACEDSDNDGINACGEDGLAETLEDNDCDDTDAHAFPDQLWFADVDSDGFGTGFLAQQCARPTSGHSAAELVALSLTGQDVLASGLVAHRSFDASNAYDMTSNGHTGTLVGNPTNTTGTVGNAMDFDGTQDKITVQDTSNLTLGANDFTITAWVKREGNNTSNRDGTIMSKRYGGNSSADEEWILSMGMGSTSSNTPGFAIEAGTTKYSVSASSNINMDQRYHLLARRNGSSLEFYIDNVLVDTENIGTVTINDIAGRDLVIANTEHSAHDPFNGMIDDIRIYNRALSTGEINNLYIATAEAHDGDCSPNSGAIHPLATEVCNLIDDNCDTQVDENVQNTYYQDSDNDSYGNAAVTTGACTAPVGYTGNNTDCNDSSATYYATGLVCNDGLSYTRNDTVSMSGATCSCIGDTFCSNGLIESTNDEGGNETCDDGNTTNGDGCNNICVIEDGYECSGTPSSCSLIGGGGGGGGSTGDAQSIVTITGGTITLQPVCNIDFGNLIMQPYTQTLTGTFPCPIEVIDQKPDSDVQWNLTMSMDNMNAGTNAVGQNRVLNAEKLSIKTRSHSTLTNAKLKNTNVENTRIKKSPLIHGTNTFGGGSTHTLAYKTTGTNDGKIGSYEIDNLELQLVIPAYTPPGTYTGAITFTLTEE